MDKSQKGQGYTTAARQQQATQAGRVSISRIDNQRGQWFLASTIRHRQQQSLPCEKSWLLCLHVSASMSSLSTPAHIPTSAIVSVVL